VQLAPHPGCVDPPRVGIDVTVARAPSGRLRLAYRLAGDTRRLSIPPPAEPRRADGLWQHSCFECFLRIGAGPRYLEFNFSPSGAWAAYGFSGYRAGMEPSDDDQVPPAVWRVGEGLVALDVELPVDLPPGSALAIAAVVERDDGALSHWALHHASGAADLHHPSAFVVELPPMETAA